MSFKMIGLSHFKHILDSFVNRPSGTSVRGGAFPAEICDFLTFFLSINEFGN